VVLNQPCRARTDRALQNPQTGRDVIASVNRLAHVVQQCRQQKFLVVGKFPSGELEHLQAMVKNIPFGMIFQRLGHVFQRLKQ